MGSKFSARRTGWRAWVGMAAVVVAIVAVQLTAVVTHTTGAAADSEVTTTAIAAPPACPDSQPFVHRNCVEGTRGESLSAVPAYSEPLYPTMPEILEYGVRYDVTFTSGALPPCPSPTLEAPIEARPCQSQGYFTSRRYVPAVPPTGSAFLVQPGTGFHGSTGVMQDPYQCGAPECAVSFYTNTQSFPDGLALLVNVSWIDYLTDPDPIHGYKMVDHSEDVVVYLQPRGTPPPPPTAPSAEFTAQEHAPASLTWDFDASASQAFDGATIAQYGWDFGDHETGTGKVVQHPYTAPGKYPVTLTVHDSRGDTDSVTHEVVVADPGLVVNSVGDTPNGATAGEQCDTGNKVGDVPECTLRAAIEAANTAAKEQPISFAIDVVGTPQITVSSALPELTAPVTIDGTTQPGGFVEVYSPSSAFDGLQVKDHATVKGMVVRGFRFGISALVTA